MPDRLFFYKGRVALYAILKALDIKFGDEVILPGFTCVVVPNAISYLHAKPVYVDIEPKTYNIDPLQIEACITEHTRAIIAQHTFGIPARMDAINDIAKKYNLYVIEDSCHAIGSKYKGKEVGTLGDAAFFSSQWSKPVTTGLGGWIQTNNPALKDNLDKLRSSFSEPSSRDDFMLRMQYFVHSKLLTPSLFWFAQNTFRQLSKHGIVVGSSTNEELEHKMPANYERKMSKWQENTIKEKLNNISASIEHRNWVVCQYERILSEVGISSVKVPRYSDVVFLRYPMLVKNKDRVLELAKKNRIEMGDWFLSPVHPNVSGWENISYKSGMCPKAEEMCQHVINLPTHTRIRKADIEKIGSFVNTFNKEF